MKHLMIFSIGPVQDFIATARRSRDLWYGSWMLSELARFVAKEIVKNKDNKLIFPASPDIESIPNKIVAVVDIDKPEVFAGDIKKATINYLVEILAKPTLDVIKSKTFNRTLADAQIKDLPELYWVSVPYDIDYKTAREEAEALLTARKVTRDFNQMLGANVPKSSLDGSRETVIDENEYPPKKKPNENVEAWEKTRDQKIKNLYDNYHARQGERLSGVDLLKRMGKRGDNDEPDFKSTSHMAAIPFMEKLGKAKADKLIDDIRNLFIKKKWNIWEKDDGALLYESRLTDWIPAGKEQDEIRKEFNEKWEENKLGDSRPSPYYALLRADGDNMGKVIDDQKEEEAHRKLSDALSAFAGKVPFIVNNGKEENRKEEKDNKGLLIYSGGDDVLAYLSINKALQCAEQLEKTFREDLKNFSAIKGKEKTTPTLSIGIVIAHHLDPLSDVLQLARDAEKEAKKITGKNGLAITLSKRSGIDRTITGKWAELSERLRELKKFFDAKLISGGTAYELQELHRELSQTEIPQEGIIKEALRVVSHKQESSGMKKEDKEKVKSFFEKWLLSDDGKKISLEELANEMIIAKALKEEANS